MTGVEAEASVRVPVCRRLSVPAACQVARFFGFGRKKQAPVDEEAGRRKGKGKGK